MTTSVFVGRSLAVMCHPSLAWNRLSPSGRVAVAMVYATLSYVTALVTLFALRG